MKGKGRKGKKLQLKFHIDCRQPVEDGIMNAADFVSLIPETAFFFQKCSFVKVLVLALYLTIHVPCLTMGTVRVTFPNWVLVGGTSLQYSFSYPHQETFLQQRIKVNGKTNNFSNQVSLERNKHKITLNADIAFSKRYV